MSEVTAKTPTYDRRRSGRLALLEEFWHYFSENRGAVMGLAFFVFICLVAIFAELIAPHGATVQYRDALLKPPAWQDGGEWRFLLGTDAASSTARAIRCSSAASWCRWR